VEVRQEEGEAGAAGSVQRGVHADVAALSAETDLNALGQPLTRRQKQLHRPRLHPIGNQPPTGKAHTSTTGKKEAYFLKSTPLVARN
jgi:hypothetical protein